MTNKQFQKLLLKAIKERKNSERQAVCENLRKEGYVPLDENYNDSELISELRVTAPPDPWRGKNPRPSLTDKELDARWQRQQSPTYKGRGTLKSPESEVGGMNLAPKSLPLPRKRKAHLDNEREKKDMRLPEDLDEKAPVEKVLDEFIFVSAPKKRKKPVTVSKKEKPASQTADAGDAPVAGFGYDGDDRSITRKGGLHLYEENEVEADMKAEVESIATEIFYAAEDWMDDPLVGGGADRLKALKINDIQKRHLKGSLTKFLKDFIADLAGVELTDQPREAQRSKPWLKLNKPFEEEI